MIDTNFTTNVNDKFVKKSGDTMTGDLTVNSGNTTGSAPSDAAGQTFQKGQVQAGAKAYLKTDNEGGTLILSSPGGIQYEFDAYNGTLRLVIRDASNQPRTISLADSSGKWLA